MRSLTNVVLTLKKKRYNIQVVEILRYSELLRNVDRSLFSDVSGQTVQSSRVKHSIPHVASHKSNPSSVPCGIVDLYSTLPWVTWEAVTFVEGVPCWGLLRHTLANGVLVYPSQGGRYSAEGCKTLGQR